MRLTILACAALLSLGAARSQAQGADTAARPNTLTRPQIAEGWVLLFDGETAFGWQPRTGGPWSAAGALEAPAGGSGALATTSEFGDFELRAEYQADAGAGGALLLRAPAQGPLGASGFRIGLPALRGGGGRLPGAAGAPAARWLAVIVRAQGDRVTATVDGRRVGAARVGRPAAVGVVALDGGANGGIRIRSIRLLPLGAKPLFNGKDLGGWKLLPGHRSTFSVTPEGWLNVRNGNGDLQTTSEWGDFVLQLDVISNGDHLNSGVFFRANKDAFWSGYEVQIRNQWQGDDRTRAVDYGTGGIYNRQPARKVVSSDREWFTVTLVARGLHMATWVDGYQVTDFTDTRPANEGNARDGARTSPGVISLQGHDPTTDLSFRGIRIAPLGG
jgi:hypothetical protein